MLQNRAEEVETAPAPPLSKRPEPQRMITAKCTSCSVTLEFPEWIEKIQCSVCRAILPTRSLVEEVPTETDGQDSG